MPMTREQAERLVAVNPALAQRAGSRERAVAALMQMDESQIPMGSPVGGRPQGAIANAMMAVPPKMVTPASPAPMQPGIPLQAPKPTAAMGGPAPQRQLLPDDVRQMAAREAAPAPAPAPAADVALAEEAPRAAPKRRAYSSPLRGALNAAEKELEMMNDAAEAIIATGQKLPPEAQVQIEMARRKVAQYRAEVQAEEGAEIPEEIADVLARREARLQGEGERITKAEKDASANALIKAGLALMNPQRGANALAALSAGLGVGLESYDAAKAAAAERRARLGQSQDEIVFQRYDALTKARDAARAAAARGQQMDRDNLALISASDKVLFDKATMDTKIEREGLETDLKRIEKQYAPAKAEAAIDEDRASAEYTRTFRGRTGSTGGPKPMTENQRLTKISQLNRERRAALVELNTPGVVGAQRQALRASIAAIDSELAGLKGITPSPGKKGGDSPPVPGAQKAPNGKWYVKDPKRPGKYLEVTS